jgi:hypothetical protein
MRPDQYNPKAREAFGKSLINIGDNIFKSLMLLFTIAPLTFILKVAAERNQQISLGELFVFLSPESYLAFLTLMTIAFLLALYFRKEGLGHLHALEDPSYKYQKRSLKPR